MNYRDQTGKVGTYRGADVFVIDYEELTKNQTENQSTIFAVRIKSKTDMDLVQKGKLIGKMTDSGRVELNKIYTNYKFYGPKAEKKKVEVSPPTTAVELDVSEGYGQYSKTVDEFFKGLNKLWDELEV